MPPVIWWVRRDLRLHENQALSRAAEIARASGCAVLPVFILDPALLHSEWAGEKRKAFLMGGLRALDASLRARGSELVIRSGEPAAELAALAAEVGAARVVAEADVSPYARARDARVANTLGLTLADGVAVQPIGSVLSGSGAPYTVFTPYSKRWLAQLDVAGEDMQPEAQFHAAGGVRSLAIPQEPSLPGAVPFSPGEDAALQRLDEFVLSDDAPLYAYAAQRDRPDLDGTSLLSPYLRFGMVSPRRAARAALEAMGRMPSAAARESARVWLNELIWRDFYLTILQEYPHVRRAPFRAEFANVPWSGDETGFAAWREGRTGYPFVDAAMRQLAQIGWMHNRARMVVASFLVKDLLIDWRLGERWFMQSLVDGDPAANNGGWQWAAGTGTDAAPYFRIFNPVAQGVRFDPHGTYVRKWLPELARVPAPLIHTPWKMTLSEQAAAGCRIGRDYPAPIVDHAFARQRALAAYAGARERARSEPLSNRSLRR